MSSTRRLLSAIALAAALGGIAACGPEDSGAADSSAGSDSSSTPSGTPSATPSKGGDAGSGDSGSDGPADDGDGKGEGCGTPPKLPAGHTMLEVKLERDSGGFEAQEAKPACTPNDWIYHGAGESRHYTLAADVKPELATDSGVTKPVTADQLSTHIDGCLRDDYDVVKSPYSCSGNIYDVTLNSKGEVQTIKEIWHP